jgi:hypothetical protein
MVPCMTYEFVYWPTADDALDRLENLPAMAAVLRAVNRTLRRLAADPFDRRLGTACLVTEGLGGVCATPVGLDDWYIIWQRGEDTKLVEIILVDHLPL